LNKRNSESYSLLNRDNGVETLSSELELALFSQFGQNHKDLAQQMRSIRYNLKDDKNEELRARFFCGELTPEQLSQMAPRELANPDLKNMEQAVRQKSLQDSILVSEIPSGPLLKKTHKGPIVMSPKRSASEENESVDTMKDDGNDNLLGLQKVPLVIDTSSDISKRKRKAGSEDYEDSIESADTLSHDYVENLSSRVNGTPTSQSPRSPPFDIRRRLSPVFLEVEKPPPLIWTGDTGVVIGSKLLLTPNCRAVQLGGPTYQDAHIWHKIFHSDRLTIDGIICPDRAQDYLYQQRCSNTKDVVIIEIWNSDPDASLKFDEILTWLAERQRFGVIKRDAVSYVKDMYVVPVQEGHLPPKFLSDISSKGNVRGIVADSRKPQEKFERPWTRDALFGILVVDKRALLQKHSQVQPNNTPIEHSSENFKSSGRSLLETLTTMGNTLASPSLQSHTASTFGSSMPSFTFNAVPTTPSNSSTLPSPYMMQPSDHPPQTLSVPYTLLMGQDNPQNSLVSSSRTTLLQHSGALPQSVLNKPSRPPYSL
jgi:hypothetical protein